LRLAWAPLQGHAARKARPYYQVIYTRKGKSSTKFVKTEDLPAVRKKLKNYGRMTLLTERWIELAMELSILRLPTKAV
jgi:hypothetical protein